jgi:hypothetical protein
MLARDREGIASDHNELGKGLASEGLSARKVLRGALILLLPPRKIACISLESFGRIEAFQWVTANPIKKSFCRGSMDTCSMEMPESGSAPRFPWFEGPCDPVSRKYSIESGFSQTNMASKFAVRRFRRSTVAPIKAGWKKALPAPLQGINALRSYMNVGARRSFRLRR